MRLRSPAGGRRQRAPARGAIAVLAAIAAAGCGSTPSPSVIQLRAQATRICSSANRLIGRIGTPTSEAGGEAFLKRGIAVLEVELRDLRTLGAPGDAAGVYRTALGAFAGELAAAKAAVHALDRQQDPAIAFKTLQRRLGPLETQADDAWRALQMAACLNR